MDFDGGHWNFLPIHLDDGKSTDFDGSHYSVSLYLYQKKTFIGCDVVVFYSI